MKVLCIYTVVGFARFPAVRCMNKVQSYAVYPSSFLIPYRLSLRRPVGLFGCVNEPEKRICWRTYSGVGDRKGSCRNSAVMSKHSIF